MCTCECVSKKAYEEVTYHGLLCLLLLPWLGLLPNAWCPECGSQARAVCGVGHLPSGETASMHSPKMLNSTHLNCPAHHCWDEFLMELKQPLSIFHSVYCMGMFACSVGLLGVCAFIGREKWCRPGLSYSREGSFAFAAGFADTSCAMPASREALGTVGVVGIALTAECGLLFVRVKVLCC